MKGDEEGGRNWENIGEKDDERGGKFPAVCLN